MRLDLCLRWSRGQRQLAQMRHRGTGTFSLRSGLGVFNAKPTKEFSRNQLNALMLLDLCPATTRNPKLHQLLLHLFEAALLAGVYRIEETAPVFNPNRQQDFETPAR